MVVELFACSFVAGVIAAAVLEAGGDDDAIVRSLQGNGHL